MMHNRITCLLARTTAAHAKRSHPAFASKSQAWVISVPASRTYSTSPPAVTVTKDENEPTVAIVTLHQSAFSHDTARQLIQV